MMIDESVSERYYYFYDGLGSVVALLNANSGDIVEGYTYDAFGCVRIHTDTGGDGIWLNGDPGTGYADAGGSVIGNPYLFTGRRLDGETRNLPAGREGLYYYRARIYNPALGRFLQTDPIGYYDSMNLYQYAFNSPTNYIDPWGLSSKGGMTDEEIFDYAVELREMIRNEEIDAVEGLARIAEVLADRYGGWNDDETGFVRHYQRLLTEYDGILTGDHTYIDSFGGTGLAAAYNDGSRVQTRHLVGFMGAGYYGQMYGKHVIPMPMMGGLAGGSFALWLNHGDSTWNLSEPDTALGYKAAWLGARLKGGLFFNLSLKDVPDYIRKQFRD